MPQLSATEVVTQPCRLAFPALYEPKPRFTGNERLTYQATLLLPPDFDLTPLHEALKAAMLAKWNKVEKLPADMNPIHPCANKEHLDGYLPGWKYISVHSDYQPAIVDGRLQAITDPKMIYPGCWCRFHINAYAWVFTGRKGVSFGLNGVQFVRDDERLDGRKAVSDVFDSIEGESPSSASSAAGSSLFD